jgi:hypothetical protein
MPDDTNQKQQENATPALTHSKTQHLSVSKIYGLLPEWIRGRLAPTLGAAIALLGFWFSPLKDIGFHKLWHESPTIELRPGNNKVCEGDEFVVSVVVTPHNIDVSPGTLFVDYSTDTLQLRSPGNVISTTGVKEASVASVLTFRALKHGPAMTHIWLKTKYGSYEATRSFIVSNLDIEARPSKLNFSGRWNLRIDQVYGELHVIDNEGAITGSYELESGDVGSIRGVRGPAAFQVSLSSTKKHQKYLVECIVNLQDEYLELKGDAKADSGSQTHQISFYASSKT